MKKVKRIFSIFVLGLVLLAPVLAVSGESRDDTYTPPSEDEDYIFWGSTTGYGPCAFGTRLKVERYYMFWVKTSEKVTTVGC